MYWTLKYRMKSLDVHYLDTAHARIILILSEKSPISCLCVGRQHKLSLPFKVAVGRAGSEFMCSLW